jgi:hypothetical protein
MDMQIEHGSKVKWSREALERLSQCARGPGFLGMNDGFASAAREAPCFDAAYNICT